MAMTHATWSPSTGDTAALPDDSQLSDLLWEVAAYTEMMGEAALAETPLSLPSSGMLQVVLGEPGITVAEISRRMPKSQQAISQVSARLERLGLLERRLGSGRGHGLFVSEAGRELAELGMSRERELEDRLVTVLGEARYAHLRRLLSETRTLLREEAR
jgi:DNA-binding MarR family transcriptional regulator